MVNMACVASAGPRITWCFELRAESIAFMLVPQLASRPVDPGLKSEVRGVNTRILAYSSSVVATAR